MSQPLYLECASGISGDMIVAALLDLGASEEKIRNALASLPVDGFEVFVTRVAKSGLDVCDFEVRLDEGFENHDHDMAYLYGSPDETEGEGQDKDDGGNGGVYDPDEQPACHHEHRGLKDIIPLIDAAEMTGDAKDIARKVFLILADAEAKAHGTLPEEVHFHEVGALDSIADIIAVAVAIDDLAPDEVIVTGFCEGRGTVRCQHGRIPVPVPAVVNIAAAYDIPLSILDVQGELVTPTGAAVVAAIRTTDELPDQFVVERIGMGAGKRAYATPGILRAMFISAL